MDDPQLEGPRAQPNDRKTQAPDKNQNANGQASKEAKQQTVSVTSAATPSIPASPSLIPLASHEQDYHKRIGFRLLIALIMLFSMGIILYAVSLSLLFDIGWAYAGVLTSLGFAMVMLTLWAFCLAAWFHIKLPLERRFNLQGDDRKRKLHLAEMTIGWVAFLVLLTGDGLWMYGVCFHTDLEDICVLTA